MQGPAGNASRGLPGGAPTAGAPGAGRCESGALMHSFGIFLQGLLGVVAFSTLMLKRFREPKHERRPWRIWFLDTSKQAIGMLFIHFANVYLADLTEEDPCSLYLINFLLDATVGMLLIYVGVRAVSVLVEWQQWESLRFGEYGNVPRTPAGAWWGLPGGPPPLARCGRQANGVLEVGGACFWGLIAILPQVSQGQKSKACGTTSPTGSLLCGRKGAGARRLYVQGGGERLPLLAEGGDGPTCRRKPTSLPLALTPLPTTFARLSCRGLERRPGGHGKCCPCPLHLCARAATGPVPCRAGLAGQDPTALLRGPSRLSLSPAAGSHHPAPGMPVPGDTRPFAVPEAQLKTADPWELALLRPIPSCRTHDQAEKFSDTGNPPSQHMAGRTWYFPPPPGRLRMLLLCCQILLKTKAKLEERGASQDSRNGSKVRYRRAASHEESESEILISADDEMEESDAEEDLRGLPPLKPVKKKKHRFGLPV
nr:store-operated calcium entry regulator STIMATE [Dasypus novemcinctus]